jgi:putative FmdB family regulatory protein
VPLYDYVCEACRHRFEVIHGVHGQGPETCPNCGKGPVRKAITAAAIHYKGSGWAKKERHAAKGRSGVKADTDGSGGEPGQGGKDADKTTKDAENAKSGATTSGDKAAKASAGTESSSTGAAEKPGTDRSAKPSSSSTGD